LKAEIESLFYADFSTGEIDVVTGVDWLGARRALLEEQKAFFRRRWPKPAAARLGLYGLSYGEDPAGEGYVSAVPGWGEDRAHLPALPAHVRPSGERTRGCLRYPARDEGERLGAPWGLRGPLSRSGPSPLLGR